MLAFYHCEIAWYDRKYFPGKKRHLLGGNDNK